MRESQGAMSRWRTLRIVLTIFDETEPEGKVDANVEE